VQLVDPVAHRLADEMRTERPAPQTVPLEQGLLLRAIRRLCERPVDFDLGSWWAEWADSFEANLNEYAVTVRVAPEATKRLGELGDAVRRAPKQPPPRRERDGWERRVLMFERPDWAESILLRLGAGVEVIDPPEMRERLEAAASELFALYHGA
jgi:predicted DNA-binding transcriptional regulator YafY